MSKFFAPPWDATFGTLPSEAGRLSDVENGVLLSGLGLSGTLPTEIGELTGVHNHHQFLLHDNGFSGALPSELGRMTLLTECLLVYGNNWNVSSFPTELHSVALVGSDRYLPSEVGLWTPCSDGGTSSSW